jgi:TPP-dependent indolepyruvate ferredoxin oxidoreductase alpha subunit
VLVVFDDINLTGSQGIFDSRKFRLISGGVWLEPKTVQECYDYAFNSFERSEESGMPLVIRMSNTNVQLTGSIECSSQKNKVILPYLKDFDAHVVHPITGNTQFEKWVLKNKRLESSLDSNSVGAIPECLLTKETGLLKVNKNYRTEQHIITDKFERLYSILRKHNYIVSMDLGGYTADYFKTADVCLCFGASTAVAGGIKHVMQERKVAAVIGDTPFLHSGKNVLPELVLRNSSIDIFVLDNGGSQGTGGQVVPGNIEKEATIYDIKYVKLHLSEIELALKEIVTKPNRPRVFHILYN